MVSSSSCETWLIAKTKLQIKYNHRICVCVYSVIQWIFGVCVSQNSDFVVLFCLIFLLSLPNPAVMKWKEICWRKKTTKTTSYWSVERICVLGIASECWRCMCLCHVCVCPALSQPFSVTCLLGDPTSVPTPSRSIVEVNSDINKQ